MATKKSMDAFGEALLDYVKGDKDIFYLNDEKGEKHVYNLAERFRPYSKLSASEKKMISLCRGSILYVGCGTGNLIPSLEERGNVTGIDISPRVIEVANSRGCNDCSVADIFSYSSNNKFDTIALFGNDLGIGGTVDRTKKLLQVLKSLLKDNGQILSIIRTYNRSEYRIMKLTPIWKGKSGDTFNWIIFSTKFISRLCVDIGMKLEVISSSWKYKVLRITK